MEFVIEPRYKDETELNKRDFKDAYDHREMTDHEQVAEHH